MDHLTSFARKETLFLPFLHSLSSSTIFLEGESERVVVFEFGNFLSSKKKPFSFVFLFLFLVFFLFLFKEDVGERGEGFDYGQDIGGKQRQQRQGQEETHLSLFSCRSSGLSIFSLTFFFLGFDLLFFCFWIIFMGF